MSLPIAVIAAVDEKWGIGKAGKMSWHYPEDFKFFKETTQGGHCFMGRTTYEEIALLRHGKKVLLPDRKCIVFSRQEIDDPRIKVCSDMFHWWFYAGERNFFIGGRAIFDFGLSIADTAYITQIPGDHGCDVRFPSHKLEGFAKYEQLPLSETLKVQVYKRE